MAKNKKIFIKNNISVLSKQKELDSLNDKKIDILKNLSKIEQQCLKISTTPEIKTSEDWLYGLPIESLKHLNSLGKLRTRLGDLRLKEDLKKSTLNALKYLEIIDNEIKIAQIDLLTIKIGETLNKAETK